MEALFQGFVDVDDQLRMLLDEVNARFIASFKSYYSSVVSDTIELWETDFMNKCPETTMRFIREYEADCLDFFTRAFEWTSRGLGPARESVESLIEEFKGDLHMLIGYEDCISIDHHIVAKNILVDLYLSSEKNTQALEKVVDDNDGAAVIYSKIDVQ